MAEPLMELQTHNDGVGAPTYDIDIISANVVDTDKVIRWGAPLSADGAILDVQRAIADKWGDELWLEDLSTTDELIMDVGQTPEFITGSQTQYMFKLSSSAVAYASNPIITCYDATADRATPDEEPLLGTGATHTSSFIKIVGAVAAGQPAQHWGESTEADLHNLETGGSVVLGAAAQGLDGDVAYMTCTTTDINGTPQYFSLALSIPEDAALGSDVIDIILSIKYTYA